MQKISNIGFMEFLEPTSITEDAIGRSTGHSQNSFNVEVDACDVCYNSNGDVKFAGLILTETTVAIRNEENYDSRQNLNAVYKTWDNYNATVGYRTTPDNWRDDDLFKCGDIMAQCKAEQPECGATRKKRAAIQPVIYEVGAEGSCQPGIYCNSGLREDKNFKLRLVVELSGGVLVGKAPEFVYGTDAESLAWVAGVVVGIAALVAVGIIVYFFIRKRISRDKQSERHQPPVYINESFHDKSVSGADDKECAYESVEDETFRKPPAIRKVEFRDIFLNMQANDNKIFQEEFKTMKNVCADLKCSVGKLPENAKKNRTLNNLPCDEHRVSLAKKHGLLGSSDYINASRMPGFILTQCPMPSTAEDFWNMIMDENVSLITNLAPPDQGRQDTCYKYWSDHESELKAGSIRVKLFSQVNLDGVTLRVFQIKRGQKTICVDQIQMLQDDDNDAAADTPKKLLTFVGSIRKAVTSKSSTGSIVVHDIDGGGLAGVFITVYNLMSGIRDQDAVDVFGVTLDMLQHRPVAIENVHQYILIHECIMTALDLTASQEGHYEDIITEPWYRNVQSQQQDKAYETLVPFEEAPPAP